MVPGLPGLPGLSSSPPNARGYRQPSGESQGGRPLAPGWPGPHGENAKFVPEQIRQVVRKQHWLVVYIWFIYIYGLYLV